MVLVSQSPNKKLTKNLVTRGAYGYLWESGGRHQIRIDTRQSRFLAVALLWTGGGCDVFNPNPQIESL